MSLRAIFNKLFFRKHTPGKVVASSGDKVFQKVEAVSEALPKPPPVLGVEPDNLSLEWLNLKPGTYTITATVSAMGLRLQESERSISVEYTVK